MFNTLELYLLVLQKDGRGKEAKECEESCMTLSLTIAFVSSRSTPLAWLSLLG